MTPSELMAKQNFKVAEVAAAADTPLDFVNNCLARDWVMGYRELRSGEAGSKRGKARLFGFPTIMEIAIAHTIHKKGLSATAEAAFSAAVAFAGVGDIDQGKGRLPALPFETGETFLIFPTGDQFGATVLHLTDATELTDLFPLLAEAVGVVDCRRVFMNVCQRLGVNGWDVLREVYEIQRPASGWVGET